MDMWLLEQILFESSVNSEGIETQKKRVSVVTRLRAV